MGEDLLKKYKWLSIVFASLGILLSNVMCAVVAFNYCDYLYGIKYCGWSAPSWVTFFLAIPFVIGIVICIILAYIFNKKFKQS